MRVIRLVAAVAAAASIAAVMALPITASAAPANPTPIYSSYPTRISESGVPEYGRVGQGVWQVAGLVNMGEPTMRIVYDQTVPGAQASAMSDVYQLQSSFSTVPQPGTTSGLREVGYSAHYDGVQFQVWGNNTYIDSQVSTAMAQAGMPLIAA